MFGTRRSASAHRALRLANFPGPRCPVEISPGFSGPFFLRYLGGGPRRNPPPGRPPPQPG
eukprot:9231810-Pyramimonas_sp.AAC.1